ncbi:EamA family transporter [Kitasatospora aureofaciens]|uniref:EamA family transporter n=1 Tax=Kitasatospora aureofaciens TaxID=1894 RepID=UPI000996B004|nr:EamA family transporter [Kitasatospora aureofaciens]HJD81939.1 EamA family transporter [Kitasatospora aureofaciens]
MLSNRLAVVLVTALAPAVWGTTYLVTTEMLPPDRPLLAAVIRCLPAGLLLIALTRTLPKGGWWWRAPVLGALNIGGFQALLFIAAYRLPGGIAATVGAVQPLVTAGLSAALLGDRLTLRTVLSGIAGVAGVSLLVLRANAQLDAIGVVAALGGAVVMAFGVVLSKRWVSPAPLLATTGWQLTAGGLLLVPVTLLSEGAPPTHYTVDNVLGYAYLCLIGAALTYAIWFRGLRALPPTSLSFLSLLSPVVATLVGWLALGQDLSPLQALGAAVVLASLVVAQTQRPRPRTTDTVAAPATGPAPSADRADRAAPVPGVGPSPLRENA